MSELAEALNCDNSNVTGIVDRLEDRGLVERRSATHDRRVKMLVVTPRGAELRAQLAERLDEAPEPLAQPGSRGSARPARHHAPRARLRLTAVRYPGRRVRPSRRRAAPA